MSFTMRSSHAREYSHSPLFLKEPIDQEMAVELELSVEQLAERTLRKIEGWNADLIYCVWLKRFELTQNSIKKIETNIFSQDETKITELRRALNRSIDIIQFTLAALTSTAKNDNPPFDWIPTLNLNSFFLKNLDHFFPFEKGYDNRPIFNRDETTKLYFKWAKVFKRKIAIISEGLELVVYTLYINKFVDTSCLLEEFLGGKIVKPKTLNLDFVLSEKDRKSLRNLR